MKTSNHPQPTTRSSRFSKVNQKHGLIVALLVLASFATGPINMVLSNGLAIAAFAALIFAFVSGHRRSDELDKLVQLKAAAISFIIVMFLIFVFSSFTTIQRVAPEDALFIIFLAGFFSHLLLLPMLAKRAYDK